MLSALLLIVVALHQRWRMYSRNQSAWKGGGFGMFSDIPRNYVGASLLVEEGTGTRNIRLPACPMGARASCIPTEQNITEWGQALAGTSWQRCGHGAHPAGHDSQVPALFVRRIDLEHRIVDFDGKAGVYRAARQASYSIVISNQGQ